MYHSITFGNKNTYDDWHLVPTSRPVFNPPEPKIKTIDIAGGNSILDVSEALTGYPVYNNRTGSFEFIVLNGYKRWDKLYSDILNYLHGRRMKCILEDDPGYYYEGRFKVNEWRSEKNWSKIIIDYSVEPYKWSTKTSLEDWLWDPFNFTTDVVPTTIFTDMEATVNGYHYIITGDKLGYAPVCPKIIFKSKDPSIVTSGRIRFVNRARGIDITKDLRSGVNQISNIVFTGEDVDIWLYSNTGDATVSIEFNQGRL